jgi:hypothetical protein
LYFFLELNFTMTKNKEVYTVSGAQEVKGKRNEMLL